MPAGLTGLWLMIPLGLCLGSFATALIARIPAGRSWIGSDQGAERSACMHCGHKLGARDLIPLFSWLFLRGRCRYCRRPIGGRYPAIESLTLLICLLVYAAYGWSVATGLLLLAAPFLVAMLVIDLEHMILPNQLQIILYALGLVFIGVGGGIEAIPPALGASFLYGALAFILARGGAWLFKRDALGMGDVKFFAVAGLWLGSLLLPAFLMLAGVAGVLLGLAWRVIVKSPRFPFGPALILSLLLLLLLRAPAVAAWLNPFLGAVPGLS